MNARTILSMIVLAALVTFLGGFIQFAGAQELEALADIEDGTGKVVGRATLTQNLPGGGVWIQVNVSGLTPGEHGIHLHAAGTCSAPGFLSAGGHFNPEARKHGLMSFDGSHAGDMPNLVASSGGTAQYGAANYRVTLGPGLNSLFDADGSALVIHAGPDDHVTDPAGNAGSRVLCGILRRR